VQPEQPAQTPPPADSAPQGDTPGSPGHCHH
jgi:hypothetical protein